MRSSFSYINSRLFLGIGCLLLLLLLPACSGLALGGGSPTPAATAIPTQAIARPTLPALPTGLPTALPTGISASSLFTQNLIVNGDAESGPGATSEETIEPIPGWTRHGSIDVIQYASTDGGSYIGQTDPGPSDRGKNYFYGGADDLANYGDNTTTSITQTINLSLVSALITPGRIQFTLTGWLGGYAGQDDHAQLTIQFVSATDQKLGTAIIGPVLDAARNHQNGLIAQSTKGSVPAATASIQVTLTMTKEEGGDNDGSADDLALSFHLS